MMNIVNYLDNRISLTKPAIDLGEFITEYLSENHADLLEDNNSFDELEYRKDNIMSLQDRFIDYYGIEINPEDGYSILTIDTENEENKIKRYLHRFLTYKSLVGGKGANSDGSAKLFEAISANSVRSFIGDNTAIIMIGEGRNNLTAEQLNNISSKMEEKIGTIRDLPSQAKDDGVDFIVFKPFDSRNVGNLVVLGQACVGKSFKSKKPIKKRWKSKYIDFAVQPPATLLSVVCFLEKEELKNIHSEFDDAIVFDRGRIMKYYDVTDTELNDKIISFVNEKIDCE